MVSFSQTQSDQPAVLCPRCQLPMMRGVATPIMFTSGLSDVVYRCEACKTETTRTETRDGAPHAGPSAARKA
jgi:hypothetical protein